LGGWLSHKPPGDLAGAFLRVGARTDSEHAAAPLWGIEEHVEKAFAAAKASPMIERGTVDFDFPSVEDAVQHYPAD
jgi:hypothetical protein